VKYTVTVERATTYEVFADSPAEAADRVLLEAKGTEVDQQTLGHSVYDDKGDCVNKGRV
jgi:hypothetical protein